MSSHDTIALIVAVIAEVIAAVLVAVEASITRISRARAEELAAAGTRGADSLVVISADPPRYINAVLFLRIGLSALAVVLVADVLLSVIEAPLWAVVIATLIMWVANFVLLGVGARTVGQQHSTTLALRTGGLVRVITAIVSPFTRGLIVVGNAITPGKGFSEGPFASEAELRAALDQAGADSLIDPDERRMLESVFELGDTTARELMVPRTEMVYIERHKRLRQALSLSLRSGFSRIPVIGENLDDVVGVLNLKDVVRRLYDNRDAENERVVDHMREPLLMPDSKRADELLHEFQSSHTHLAILVDEYGGTAGLVTVEDILEEIVGEISDEYDQGEIPELTELGDDDYRVSARMSVDDLADITGLDLTEDEDSVDTVGGLLGLRLGVVPIPGSQVDIDGYRLTAETAEGRRNRVSTVRVRKITAGGDDSTEATTAERPLVGDEGAGAATATPRVDDQPDQLDEPEGAHVEPVSAPTKAATRETTA